MRSVNPLTGQLYVAMAFDPKTSELVDYDATVWPIQIPSLAGSFDKLQEQLKARALSSRNALVEPAASHSVVNYTLNANQLACLSKCHVRR
jgi:nitrate reductase cytochrome c-type subunit